MSEGDRFVVVGLGNPGADYAGTRHNAGYMVVDRLAERAGASFRRHKTGAQVAEMRTPGGHPLVLVKTGTYMNTSGGPTEAVLRFYKVPVEHLVVVHDEIDLPFDELRIKEGGGHAGHNGLRDIIRATGSNAFLRVRMGMGRPPGHKAAADYVLGTFGKSERETLPTLVEDAADAVVQIVDEGVAAAQRVYHTRVTS